MKRFYWIVVLALGMSATTSFAQTAVDKNAWKLDINMPKLSRCLNLTGSQYDKVAGIADFFAEKLQYAGYAKGEKQSKRLREAVYGNFKLMKQTLDDEQYRKYVQIVNLTLKHKGLDVYMEDMASR